FEHLGATNPHFGAPSGYVCRNRAEAARVANALVVAGSRSLVLKSDRGDGGKGIWILNHMRLADHTVQGGTGFLSLIEGHEYWDNTPVIVEEAIGDGIALTTPSFNGVVDQEGAVTTIGCGRMQIKSGHLYLGVEMGTGVLLKDNRRWLEQLGTVVGEHVSR